MTSATHVATRQASWRDGLRRLGIATLAFLTLADLFAAQAILPVLTPAYGVSPAAMALAVNASTFGMAVGGLLSAVFGLRLGRRSAVVSGLLLLAVPTFILAGLPPLWLFAAARIVQGVCMAVAFAATLAWLGERGGAASAGDFAAYITGNVASNLIGRLIAGGVADHCGLATTFIVFTLMNLAGALLAGGLLREGMRHVPMTRRGLGLSAVGAVLREPAIRAGCAIGFCILFAFIGTFTFVNFVLVRPPLSLGMMRVGLVYLIFLPSIVTTPLAGVLVRRLGDRPALAGGLTLAIAGLPLLLSHRIGWVLSGLVAVSVGTFLAQAVATGLVSRRAGSAAGPATGLYLASYFSGGLVGSAVLGLVFDHAGWFGCVLGIGCVLVAATVCSFRLPSSTSS